VIPSMPRLLTGLDEGRAWEVVAQIERAGYGLDALAGRLTGQEVLEADLVPYLSFLLALYL
jgi:hypothetical protein